TKPLRRTFKILELLIMVNMKATKTAFLFSFVLIRIWQAKQLFITYGKHIKSYRQLHSDPSILAYHLNKTSHNITRHVAFLGSTLPMSTNTKSARPNSMASKLNASQAKSPLASHAMENYNAHWSIPCSEMMEHRMNLLSD